MSVLIELRNVYKIYRGSATEIRALDGVSLTVESGEFLVVTGHSGSGKTTLMNILGCLDAPTAGRYILNGKDTFQLSDSRLSCVRNQWIGFVFQSFHLIRSLNALENVELPLLYRGVRKSERRRLALEALERVGLGNRVMHRPAQLSGGQQQRVAIARAVAAQPAIMLADEPTGNLDAVAGGEVMNTLLSLNRQGRTVVLITHDGEIAGLAHRAIHMRDGKIDGGQE